MKKIFSIISSAVLAVGMVCAAPANDLTHAKKLSGAGRSLTTHKAAAKTATPKGLNVLKQRTVMPYGLSMAKAGNVKLTQPKALKVLGAEGQLPNLKGSVIYNDTFTDENQPVGLYSVSTTGTELLFEGPTANGGGVAVDGVYYAVSYSSFWGFIFVDVSSWDLETGEQLGSFTGEIDNIAVGGMTLDPSTGDVYGITYTAAGDGLQLAKIEASEQSMTSTAIAPLDGQWNSIACDAQGQLYGISYEGVEQGESFVVTSSTLCKIDKTNGAVTTIGATGMAPQYLSSAAIDPVSGRMFWNVCPADETGILCEVNLTTGVATTLGVLANSDEIMGMFVAAPEADDKAPAAPLELFADFPNGSLSGTVSFVAPSTLFDGTAATGNLTYKVLANGTEVASGTTTFGATVSAPVTVATPGEYTLVATVSNETGASPKAKVKMFIGNGTPVAPTATLAYADGKMTLSWTAVTTTVEGGYIDPEAVTYTVTRFPDETVVAEGLKATTFEEAIATPEGLTQYYYTVVAHAGDVTSATATSNVVTLGSIVPPYANSLKGSDTLDGFTILDANNDGKTWTTNADGARISYNSSLEMDDWLITPPLKLQGGKMYFVNFNAAANSASFPERIEVKAGTTATVAGMTMTLLEPTVVDVPVSAPLALEAVLVAPADGIYYIGFHGMSDKDQFYLYVNELSVSAASATTAPGKPTDFSVLADASGALKATVSFKTPSVDIAGNALTALTKVEVSRDGEVVKSFDAPALGEALSYEDVLTAGGEHSWSVQAFNADGAGLKVSAQAFVGFKAPVVPANINMTEEGNTGKVTITWDAVTEDIDGKHLTPADVTYTIGIPGSYGVEPLVEGLTETSYTLQAVPEGEQDFVQYAVIAVTAGGQDGAYTDMIAAGTPYDGMQESFPDGTLNYIWGTGYSDGASWKIANDETFSDVQSMDGDGGFMYMQGQYIDNCASVFTGKISLENAVNPGISFYTYIINSDSEDQFKLYVKEVGSSEWVALGEPIILGSLSETPGWAMATASLAAYAGKTVQVRFEGLIKTYATMLLDNINIGSMLGNDLVARNIEAPLMVKAGSDYQVTVTVGNAGTLDATDFTVELYADGKLAETKVVDILPSGKNTSVVFNFSMSPVATEATDYYAEVKYAADENTANNTTETASVSPKHSNLPAVTDLAAANSSNGVVLTWSEPDLTNAPVEPTEVDFEDAQAWAWEYAGWTFVDVDQSAVGGFQGKEIPGQTAGQSLLSYFVFDNSGDEWNQTFDAHSGTMYLAALFRYDGGQTDDWAISPALDGSAQTISFWARSYSGTYPEKIEMLYSTGSLETADFVSVNTIAAVPGEWTEYTFEVPAGAKYFAIRSCASDSFMLMLDDFKFQPAGGTSAALSIVGYDIYRDGFKITNEPTGETDFIDEEATEGNHSYVVVTVYETGISAPSNTATLDVVGLEDALADGLAITAGKGTITVTGAEGLFVQIAAADGKSVYAAEGKASETVTVAPGVYVVKAGNTVVKVIVK